MWLLERTREISQCKQPQQPPSLVYRRVPGRVLFYLASHHKTSLQTTKNPAVNLRHPVPNSIVLSQINCMAGFISPFRITRIGFGPSGGLWLRIVIRGHYQWEAVDAVQHQLAQVGFTTERNLIFMRRALPACLAIHLSLCIQSLHQIVLLGSHSLAFYRKKLSGCIFKHSATSRRKRSFLPQALSHSSNTSHMDRMDHSSQGTGFRLSDP